MSIYPSTIALTLLILGTGCHKMNNGPDAPTLVNLWLDGKPIRIDGLEWPMHEGKPKDSHLTEKRLRLRVHLAEDTVVECPSIATTLAAYDGKFYSLTACPLEDLTDFDSAVRKAKSILLSQLPADPRSAAVRELQDWSPKEVTEGMRVVRKKIILNSDTRINISIKHHANRDGWFVSLEFFNRKGLPKELQPY